MKNSTLNMEDRNVFHLDLSVEQCRDFNDDVAQAVEEALDEPQGFVFSGEGHVAWLLIRVTKEGE